MNNSNNYSGNNRHNDHLGVNKMGKNIRKSPIHQPNYGNNNNTTTKAQPPQPHVYNISKNEFRDMVQQLTGSPLHSQGGGAVPPPRPPNNLPKPQSMRLQRIRPPPLTPINQPPLLHPPPQVHPHPFNNNFSRPPMGQQHQHQHQQLHSPVRPHGEANWGNPAESPISAYMRYLQHSMNNPSPMQPQLQPQPPQFQHQAGGPPQPQRPLLGLLSNPHVPPPYPSPHGAGPAFPSSHGASPPYPSPRGTGLALLPSPSTPYVLPSPTSFLNLFSPRSPYPPLSPGFQFPPPLTPNFFSQSGILGPGPLSPSQGLLFPPSPSGFFPMSSPRWRGQ